MVYWSHRTEEGRYGLSGLHPALRGRHTVHLSLIHIFSERYLILVFQDRFHRQGLQLFQQGGYGYFKRFLDSFGPIGPRPITFPWNAIHEMCIRDSLYRLCLQRVHLYQIGSGDGILYAGRGLIPALSRGKAPYFKTEYIIGERYLTVTDPAPTYKKVREQAKNWEHYFAFYGLYSLTGEGDGVEILSLIHI